MPFERKPVGRQGQELAKLLDRLKAEASSANDRPPQIPPQSILAVHLSRLRTLNRVRSRAQETASPENSAVTDLVEYLQRIAKSGEE